MATPTHGLDKLNVLKLKPRQRNCDVLLKVASQRQKLKVGYFRVSQ